MSLPTLLILAAGMGSRFGGLKQFEPLGPQGETLMDYSVHDALKAGFGRVVFVIRKEFEANFKQGVVTRYSKSVPVALAYQDLKDLPAGSHPAGDRQKPWGTGQAVWAARQVVQEPFAMINADDFYGAPAFHAMAEFLKTKAAHDRFAMVAYRLAATTSSHGSVSRGICQIGESHHLLRVKEMTRILPEGQSYKDHATDTLLKGDESVSMNFWGLHPAVFGHLEQLFARFLKEQGGDAKSEFQIPTAIDALISTGETTVQVLKTESPWFGLTYREESDAIRARLAELHASGAYPQRLFG